uniref:ATP synthase complex subunit 8 n=1 Tax=Sagmariasus verreauxi TaxID=1412110 RepID=U6C1B4_9EUCA|nr:ATP synthase F0 subunit 8 [Sagmariasus verreauxi]BAO02869.1 ATP synthase F0 subunit 8 [Sagmariasus verreauxi]
MPQMSPLLWLNLFIMFLVSLVCFIVMNYFICPADKIAQPSIDKKTSEKPWKW